LNKTVERSNSKYGRGEEVHIVQLTFIRNRGTIRTEEVETKEQGNDDDGNDGNDGAWMKVWYRYRMEDNRKDIEKKLEFGSGSNGYEN
jgi:hypothetical protein